MVKFKTLDAFYKRKIDGHDTTEITNQNNKRSKASTSEPEPEVLNQPLPDEHIPETGGPNSEEVDPNSLERDPAKRKQLSLYPVNQQEQNLNVLTVVEPKSKRTYQKLGICQKRCAMIPESVTEGYC
ncbi:hypothetical protein L1887_15087 [Cichorium endivia]|nr:hypothetical protein L1887_15087 [Cichorium endivia]